MECSKCGISGEKALLFDVISKEGIIKICRKCSFEDDLPIIRKPTFSGSQEEEKQTVHERLSRISGISPVKKVNEQNFELKIKDEELRKISNKNVADTVMHSKKMENLVENFHWIIMRARRSKKLTQVQFAEKISEPEISIQLAEKGIIPKGKRGFVQKLEMHLGIRILKDEIQTKSFDEEKEKIKAELIKKAGQDEVDFDEVTTKTLTIADLKDLRKKQEEKLFVPIKKATENKPEFKEDLRDKRDLTEEEMNDIIFGRR